MLKDPALECLQLGARVDAELLDEHRSCRATRIERICLPSGAAEGEHVLGAEALAVGLGRDQPLQLRHELVVAPECELRVVQKFDRLQAALLESGRLRVSHRLLGEVGERGSAPETERVAEILGCVRWPPGREGLGSALDQALVAGQVELVGIESQRVARAMRFDPVRPERLAEAVDVHLERRDRRPRGLGAPQDVDQPVSRHDDLGVQEQERQQRPLLGCAQLQWAVLAGRLDRPQNPEFDVSRPLSQPGAKWFLSASLDGAPEA